MPEREEAEWHSITFTHKGKKVEVPIEEMRRWVDEWLATPIEENNKDSVGWEKYVQIKLSEREEEICS